jgi:hypothetical protein
MLGGRPATSDAIHVRKPRFGRERATRIALAAAAVFAMAMFLLLPAGRGPAVGAALAQSSPTNSARPGPGSSPSTSAAPSARAEQDVVKRASAIGGTEDGKREVEAIARWLGLPPPSDLYSNQVSLSVLSRQNLDLDPESELVWSISLGTFEIQLVTFVLDPTPGGLVAVGVRTCAIARGFCTLTFEKAHDNRFVDLVITGEGSVSYGNANALVLSSVEIVTQQRGRLETILEWSDAAMNGHFEIGFAKRPPNAPRVLEIKPASGPRRRFHWNGKSFRYE